MRADMARTRTTKRSRKPAKAKRGRPVGSGRGKRAKRKMSSANASLRQDTIPRSFLGRELQRQIDRFGLSREVAGAVVDDAASQMSRLMNGHIGEFSAERLAKMLVRLGSDITITLRHAGKLGRRGRVRVGVT
jgi:predicted XRE-type DNA-binding protein